MPYWLASAVGRLFDTVWAVTRKDGDPPISRSMMRMIGQTTGESHGTVTHRQAADDRGRTPAKAPLSIAPEKAHPEMRELWS
jgi:hypothetical protein